MAEARSVIRNLSSATLMRVASAGLSFALFTFLARSWSTVHLGEFATILAIFTLLQQAPLLGLHLVLSRDTAAGRETRVRQAINAGVISVAVSLVLAAAVFVLGRALYPPAMHAAFGLMALALIPTALASVVESLLWGEERMDTVMSVNLIENLVRVTACVALVRLGYGLTAMWACFLAARFVMLAGYLAWGGLRDVWQLSALDPVLIGRYLRMCPTYAGILAASAGINRVDFVLLSKLGRIQDVSYYATAYRLNELALMAPIALSIVLFPVFTRFLAASEERFLNLIRGVFRFNFIVGVPLAVAIALAAGPILSLLFGTVYAESTIVLRLLIFVPVLAGLDQVLTSVQLIRGRQGDDLVVLTITSVFYVALLVALIPRLGFLGAAIATLATSALQLSLRYGFTRRFAGVPPLIGLITRPALAGLVMAAVVVFTRQLHPALTVSLGAASYLIALFLLGGVTRSDLAGLAAAASNARGSPA